LTNSVKCFIITRDRNIVMDYKMVTIYDIAKKAKVSSATVSRVLNGGSVSPSTKERIMRIIEKEGYTPDSNAIYLKRAKTKKIGLIVPDISNPGYPETVKVIHDIMKSKGYHLILGNTYRNIEEEKSILEIMQRERVAGIIVATCEGEDDRILYPLFKRLIENGIPVVFMGKKKERLPVDIISVNNFTGAFKMTDYLLRTGKKKIGFIAGRKSLRATEERLAGYIEAHKKRGMKIHSEIVICEGEYTIEFGKKWTEKIIKEKVDAIFCGNDLMAIGAINKIEASGFKVPEDIAVAGFDDIFLATLVKPSLTTVHQPLEKIASIGCERLIGWIKRKLKENEEILIEPEIIIRESA